MKKQVLAAIAVWLVSVWSMAFAYTPSANLETQLETVVVKIESIIDSKGEWYRATFITALEAYETKYSGNERASYIIDYLITNISSESVDTVSTVSGDYTGEYTISDSTYGTEVDVTIAWDVRTITSNAIANHTTGEFPAEGNPNTISEQDKEWELDVTPTYTGDASWARESGVAYNGVKFELETAERVECESGETYKIEAIQDMVNLWLDYNNAHVQPTGEYHYHGIADAVANSLEWDDVVHVGYANDGFPIYYSKEGSYTSSFEMKDEAREWTSCTYRGNDVVVDWTTTDGTYGSDYEYVEGAWNLDSCNGAYVDWEYVYFMTQEFPYGPRCLNGESSSQWWAGGWQGGQWGQGWGQWAWERPERWQGGWQWWERPER